MDRALAPVLSELAGCVQRMGANEREAAGTVEDHLQLIMEGQVHASFFWGGVSCID